MDYNPTMNTEAEMPQPRVPGGRRERAKTLKRGRILAAARARLADQGYDGMTMAQVAEDADVAIGTVFQYAATKPELLMLVTADRWSRAIPALIENADPGGEAALGVLRLLSPLVDASRDEPEVTMAIARELLFGTDGPHRREVVALVRRLEEAIERLLSAHGAEGDVSAAARLIVSGGLIELNRTRTGLAGQTPVEARLRAMLDLVLAGVMNPTSPPVHSA